MGQNNANTLMLKWNWPLARKLINVYKEYGFIKGTLYVIFILIGIKVVIINGAIFILNLFGAGIEYAPILKNLGII